MEMIKIEREALLLDAKEKETLINCLKYVRHRLVKHEVNNGIPLCFVKHAIEFLEKGGDDHGQG